MFKPAPEKSIEIILVGDTGDVKTDGTDPVLKALGQILPQSPKSAVIFLGDNIYPKGLPSEFDMGRQKAEKILKAQLEVVKDYQGTLAMISGNHDWHKGRKDGLDYVLRQETFVNEYLGGRSVYLPPNGTPGPAVLEISSFCIVVLVNSQWWMNLKMARRRNLNSITEEKFFYNFSRILAENRHKRVIVCAHQPIYSYALHGGRFQLKHHLFPLSIYNRLFMVPLPFLGTLLTWYRKFFGAKEDFAHPRYTRYRKMVIDVLDGYDNIVYASGHEHNLQYIRRENKHFIISGSGSKVAYVEKGKYSVFSKAAKGFFRLLVGAQGQLTIQAFRAENGHPELVFESKTRMKAH